MVVKAPNGQEMPNFERLARTFWRAETSDENALPSLATKITPEVAAYEQKLKEAMTHSLQGHPVALETFEDARRIRSALLSSPELKNNDILHEYVTNTMIIADSGDMQESLDATKAMYGKSLDPNYKGEEPQAEVETAGADTRAKVDKAALL